MRTPLLGAFPKQRRPARRAHSGLDSGSSSGCAWFGRGAGAVGQSEAGPGPTLRLRSIGPSGSVQRRTMHADARSPTPKIGEEGKGIR